MIIPHSRPIFNAAFSAANAQIIQSGFVTHGAEASALELDIHHTLKLDHIAAVDSGTSALMLTIRALTQGKKNPRIGIPAYACTSLLFAVKAAQATPVFIDCSCQLTLNAEQTHQLATTLDALVLVHPFGFVEPLASESFPCPIIEDIAQSVGATLHGQPVGSFGDVCIGSLYATKPWGGAYGGFIAAKKAALVADCKAMTNPDQADLGQAYVGHHLLSDIHASLARMRLQQAAHQQTQRLDWRAQYDEFFKGSLATTPIKPATDTVSNAYRYIIQLSEDVSAKIDALRALGIMASRPVQQPLHRKQAPNTCPQAEKAWKHSISIPLLADMSTKEFTFLKQGLHTCFNF